MFDNPKKELEKLEKQLLEDEDWFQRELDSAKRMIGQVPAGQQRPSGSQPSRSAVVTAPVRTTQSKPKSQAGKAKTPVKKRKKSNKGLLTLMCLEILGILGLVAFWLLVLLK